MNEWSLEGGIPELKIEPKKEEILTVSPPSESQIDNAIEQEKTGLFGGWFSRPDPPEVKVISKKIKFSPYLIIEASYLARYVRKRVHKLDIKSDVVSVKIKDEVFHVNKKPVTISTLLSKGISGLSFGGGAIGFSFQPLESLMQIGFSKALGEKDLTLTEKKSIEVPNVLEQAICCKGKTYCFDASTASISEKSNVLKLLQKDIKTKGGRPKGCKEILNTQKVIEEVKKKLVNPPTDGRVLEHLFKISKMGFVFLPQIHAKVKYKRKVEDLIIDGITLKKVK